MAYCMWPVSYKHNTLQNSTVSYDSIFYPYKGATFFLQKMEILFFEKRMESYDTGIIFYTCNMVRK